MASTGNVFDDIPGIPRPLLTRLPHSLQVMIVKLADNHAATVGVCKSMKIVSDEAQVMWRKELVSDIPDWEKNWDAFNYITKKEWGVDGYVPDCDCVKPDECWECEASDKSNETEWEMKPRHFSGETHDLKRMVSRVFGDRCLVGHTDRETHPPFEYQDDEIMIVFHHRTVLVTSSKRGDVCVRIRDHAHGGIQPVLINQRWREKTDLITAQEGSEMMQIWGDTISKSKMSRMILDNFFKRAAEIASKVLSVLGKKDFVVEVDHVDILRGDRVFLLKHFPRYNEGILTDVMKSTCKRHHVIVRGGDVDNAIVMRAWENGPIAFQTNGLLFTSKELEKMIPRHILRLI